MAMEPIVSLLIIKQNPFCLSASPDKQKILSLRPRRLCGENVILDKHVRLLISHDILLMVEKIAYSSIGIFSFALYFCRLSC